MTYPRRKPKIFETVRGRGQYAYGPLGVRIFAPLGSAEFDLEVAKQNAQAHSLEPNTLGELLATFHLTAKNIDDRSLKRHVLIFHWLDSRRDAALKDIDLRYVQRLWKQAKLARGYRFANDLGECLQEVFIWGQEKEHLIAISGAQLQRLRVLATRSSRDRRKLRGDLRKLINH